MKIVTSTLNVQGAVCAAEGHRLAVLEYPGRTEEMDGYSKEVLPGFDILCTACGLTLEEIRAGKMKEATPLAAESR